MVVPLRIASQNTRSNNQGNHGDSQRDQGCASSMSVVQDDSIVSEKLQGVCGSHDQSPVKSHDVEDHNDEEPMSLESEESLSLHPEVTNHPVSSVETYPVNVIESTEQGDDEFTRIKNLSPPGSEKHTVKETQGKSLMSPIMSASFYSSKKRTSLSPLSQSQSILQDVITAKARTNLERRRLHTSSSNAAVRNSAQTMEGEVNEKDKEDATEGENSVVGNSTAEEITNEVDLERGEDGTVQGVNEHSGKTHQSLPRSKIYMGSVQMKQLSKKKQKGQTHFGVNADDKSIEASVHEQPATSSRTQGSGSTAALKRSGTRHQSPRTQARRSFSPKGVQVSSGLSANASKNSPLMPIQVTSPIMVGASVATRVPVSGSTAAGCSWLLKQTSGPLVRKQNLLARTPVPDGLLHRDKFASGRSVSDVRSMAEKLLNLNDHHYVDEVEDFNGGRSPVIPLQNLDQVNWKLFH